MIIYSDRAPNHYAIAINKCREHKFKMRYIKGLTKDTIKLLKRIYKQSKYYQVRQRSHCILLSYERYKISELMAIFKVSRNTIYNWLNNWEANGLVGLYNREGYKKPRQI